MKSRRGLTTAGFAAASAAVMMILSSSAGAFARSSSELSATHAKTAADASAWAGLRSLTGAVREARQVVVNGEGSRLTVAAASGETCSYYVDGRKLYRELPDGSRRVLQNELESVRFEVDGGYVVLQVTSRQVHDDDVFVVTRGSELRLR